jgi:hypothetical protein
VAEHCDPALTRRRGIAHDIVTPTEVEHVKVLGCSARVAVRATEGGERCDYRTIFRVVR